MKNYFIYIICNKSRSTLYVGVTNNLQRRLLEHFEQRGKKQTFAGRYHCHYLLYFERFSSPSHAIQREKEIKKWRREKKVDLIKTTNPNLDFLNKTIIT